MNQDTLVVVEHLRGQVADISYVMLAAARELARTTGSRVTALLLGHDAESLAGDLGADRVWYVEHPSLADFTSDAYQRVLEGLIRDAAPRAVLLGDTSIGGDLAGWLSARLAIPLVGCCRSLSVADGKPKFVSQICGGKILVEGDLPEPAALVAMVPGGFKPEQGRSAQAPELARLPAPPLEDLSVTVKDFVEPATGDVDVSKESILVAVGRGIQNAGNLELAQELARALGGEVCASRPVVDQGWLPASRLVGKSGKRVKPKLYLALGISGAPEHVEGIADSEMIVAVNTDAAAPIFDVARYGAVVDLCDLVPVLIEKCPKV